jgi:hypothetical protein
MKAHKRDLKGSIIFYSFVFGCVLVAFLSGFYFGRELERNDCNKRIDKAKNGGISFRK